jgi:hypothetical protein
MKNKSKKKKTFLNINIFTNSSLYFEEYIDNALEKLIYFNYFNVNNFSDSSLDDTFLSYNVKTYEHLPVYLSTYDKFYLLRPNAVLQKLPILNENLSLSIIKQYGNFGPRPTDFPYKELTPKIYEYFADILSFISHSYPLNYIPHKYRSFNVCKKFIEVEHSNLQYVPKNIENYKELLNTAIKKVLTDNLHEDLEIPQEYLSQIKKISL